MGSLGHSLSMMDWIHALLPISDQESKERNPDPSSSKSGFADHLFYSTFRDLLSCFHNGWGLRIT